MWNRERSILRSPLRDDAFGGGGGGGGGSKKATPTSPSPAGTPSPPAEFVDEMNQVKTWADKNDQEANHDRINFWLLKVPAIVVSAGAGVLAFFRIDALATIAAGIASGCVLVDGLRPRGLLHAAHRRAASEIYALHATMASQWRQGALNGLEPRTLAAKILNDSTAERARINKYITQVESSSLGDHGIHV
jgi:hypothetical protein